MIHIYQYICDVCQKQLYSYSVENTLERASNHHEDTHKDKTTNVSIEEIKEIDPSIFLNTQQYTPVSIYVPNSNLESDAKLGVVYFRMTDSDDNLITIYIRLKEVYDFLFFILALTFHGLDCAKGNPVTDLETSKLGQFAGSDLYNLLGYSIKNLGYGCPVHYKYSIRKNGEIMKFDYYYNLQSTKVDSSGNEYKFVKKPSKKE